MSGSSTIAIHADRDVYPSRAVARPIYQTAAFWTEDAEQFAQVAVNPRGHDFYTRYGNPNHAQVAAVVAELEHAEAAMVTASGMAALTTAVLGLVSAGDYVIGQKSTYGGTASVLLNLLPRLGITTTQVDQTEPEAFERALTPRTRLILLESPSNPLLQITDLRAIAATARTRGVLTLADNTFATPLNQRPIDFGIDLVWHSATKYLNGHSDVSAGVLAGSAEILNQIWDVALLTAQCLARSMPGCCCAVSAPCHCACPGTTATARRSRKRSASILLFPGCITRDCRPTRSTRWRPARCEGSVGCSPSN
jgi:methionine-gamma-lyase